jgi:hypothetical protein
MNPLCRLFGGLILLSLAGLALFLAGCGSSSSHTTNGPFEMAGTWTITISSGGTTVGTVTAQTVSIPLVAGDCQVSTPVGNFAITGATTCFLADANAGQGSITHYTGTFDYPPAGFLLAVAAADPIAANTTAQVFAFFVETDGANVEVFDSPGSVTAHTKSMSGTFSCDSGTSGCTGQSGSWTATHR